MANKKADTEGSASEPQKAPQPGGLVKGLSSAGYKESDIVGAPASYDEQKIWRVVTSDGQKHDISYGGKLLKGGKIKKPKKEVKK